MSPRDRDPDRPERAEGDPPANDRPAEDDPGGGGRPPARDGGEREGDGAPEWVDRLMPAYRDATKGHREIPASQVEAHEEARPRRGERDFETDVERLHRPLFREPRDPVEGREPAPWWLWAIAAVALFWGGWYLGQFGGRFGIGTHLAYAEGETYVEAEAAESFVEATADPLEAGLQIYASRCQQCHQQTGLGVPGVFPPLIGAEWVTGPSEVLVLILLNGLQGPITVRGELYNGAMPAWRDVLSDVEIAAVATYIRQWETNDAPPVDPELVARLREATVQRQTPWTVEELLEAVEAPEIRAAVEGAGGVGQEAGPGAAAPAPAPGAVDTAGGGA